MNIQSYNPSFQANINSRKLKFERKDFYVPISGYGKNKKWANEVRNTADNAVDLIRKNTLPESVLISIVSGVKKANDLTKDIFKINHTGILRQPRTHWHYLTDWDKLALTTNYSEITRYATYQRRFDFVAVHPLKKPYEDIDLTVPIVGSNEKFLLHGNPKNINNAFKHIFSVYKDFQKSFNSRDVNEAQLLEINSKIAEIRWLLAHATPWARGSDAISNVLMRAMYKSLGIKSYPIAKGFSLDLEAYCTEMNDYKRIFDGYFEKPPKIIE